MPDDQPDPHRNAHQDAPPDPFSIISTAWINILEMYRHTRKAGATMTEGAFLTAGFVIMNGAADETRVPPDGP